MRIQAIGHCRVQVQRDVAAGPAARQIRSCRYARDGPAALEIRACPGSATPLQHLIRRAGVGQRQRERAAGPATGQAAAAGSRDSGERSAAGEHNVQLGRVARGRAFLAVEARVQRTVRHQRNSVIGSSAQPRLHRRRHVDEDELVLIGGGERHAGGNGRSQRRSVAGFEGALGPRAVDVVHVKAAGRGHGIEVEFERGLGDIGAGVAGRDRRQVELNERSLRALDIEQRLGAVVGGGGGRVGVGIADGRKLAISRRTRQQGQS